MAVGTGTARTQVGADADHPIDWPISRTFLRFAFAFIFIGASTYLLAVLAFVHGQELRALLALSYALVAGVAWLVLARGHVRAAVWILGTGIWVCLTTASFLLGGVGGTPVILYPPIILLAGWMIGARFAAFVAAMSALATLAMVLVESAGHLPAAPPAPPLLRWIVECFVFALTAFLVIYSVRAYSARLAEARTLGAALAERAALLEAREADLNRAQAVANVGSWVYDLVADRMHLSVETCRIFGLPPGVTGNHDTYLARVHADDRAGVDAAWQAALAGGSAFDNEHRILVGEAVRWVRQKAELQGDGAGRFVRAVGTTQDITERKLQEARMQAAQSQLTATLDAIPDLLFEVDSAGRYHDFHSPRAELLAAPAEQLIGRTVAEMLPAAAAQTCLAALREAREAGRSHGKTYELLLPQGRRWFELSVAKKATLPGQDLRFIVISRDITERKQAEEDIRRFNSTLEARVRERTADLQKANQELESFSYTISHDLRAPLRSMVGFSGLLMESLHGRLDAESRGYLERIAASGNRMSRLIDGVLEYSRLARSEVMRVEVDLDLLVADIIAEMRERHPHAEVVLHPLGRVEADQVMVRQIFANLIGNAFKYSAAVAAPRVEIGARTSAGGTEYFVSDNGIGFDMKHAEHLFSLFTRLHSDPGLDGTGAGLAIVKRLVERHNGHIRAEAEPGRGATFSFSL